MPLTDQTCPRCHGTRVWESSSGRLRGLARAVALYPLRCDGCRHRFWRLCWNPPPLARQPRRGKLAA